MEDAKKLRMSLTGASVYGRGRFRRGETVEYWLDDVQCEGDEDSLFHCKHHQPIGKHNCGRKERAGVHCLSMSIRNFNIILHIC